MKRIIRILLGIVLCLIIAISLAACGESGGDSNGDGAGGGGNDNSAGTAPSTVTAQSTLPVGDATCPNGGVKLDYGIDENKNGVLDDPAEVDGSEYICNGEPGSDGSNGSDGLTALINITTLTIGDSNCPNGGYQIDSGLDLDTSGTLDNPNSNSDNEITATKNICNGVDSTSGGSISVTVTTIAGDEAGYFEYGNVDGTGTEARFYYPYDVAVDSSGIVYVADYENNSIRKITPAGVVTILAGGSAGEGGIAEGTGTEARFYNPSGIAVDSLGIIFVADTSNHRIRKVTAAGVVTTFAGSVAGYLDDTGTAAQFSSPRGIAIDSSDNIYVIDDNRRIRKITPAGVVTTLAGNGSLGSIDGTATEASFRWPRDVAVDSSGNVYVADTENHKIRKVTPAGDVSTLAGSQYIGDTNGTGINASFKYPEGIAVDTSGNIYVADTANYKIRKITPAGEVTTLAGGAGHGLSGYGSTDGTGAEASFNYPRGLDIDSSGNIYIADTANHKIRKITQ
jgi:sugar lactone lactonase YvrE